MDKTVVRRVIVNRGQARQQMIDSTGRKQDIDKEVLETMPLQGTGIEEVDVYFFFPSRYLTIDEQEKKLAAAGLEPDYYAQVQVNIDDPSFADEHPNGAQWDNKDGQASYVAFYRYGGARSVRVHRRDRGWYGDWWFAGRKVS